MEWLTELVGANGKNIGQFSVATILVLAATKWGDKVLTFVLQMLGIRGERRYKSEVSLQAQLDEVKDQCAVIGGALLLVCEGFDTMSTTVRDDAKTLREHLEKHGCLDELTKYILDRHEKMPTLADLQKRQEGWPNLSAAQAAANLAGHVAASGDMTGDSASHGG